MTEIELRNSVVAVMVSWLGAIKGDNTHKTIIDIYNTIKPLPRGVRMSYTMDWCAACVSAAFQAAGLIDLIPAECSCGNMMRAAQELGIWVEDDNYKPQIGDLVFYDWQDDGFGDNRGAPDHIGLIQRVSTDDKNIWVIEGNTGKQSTVGQRLLKVNNRYIRGFITPNYISKEALSKPTAPWYEEAMTWAKDIGLMDGTRPLDQITRAEVATIVQRFYHLLKRGESNE